MNAKLIPVRLLTASLLAPLALLAQDAPTAAERADSEVITLPEFAVTATSDRDAWVATEALSGTRTASPIIDLPFAIQVLTSEFIDAFQMRDLDEFGRFISSFSPGEVESGGGGGSRLRGFVPPSYRNGFRRTGVGEVVNLDRVEIIKGPLSALYGRAEPGGLVNYITKRPRTRHYQRLSASVGDYDYHRFDAETTGPVIKDRLYYRVDASYTDYEGEMDYFFQRTWAVSTSWTLKFSDTSSVTFDFERMERRSNTGTAVLQRVGTNQSGTNVYNRTGGLIVGIPMEWINFNIWGPYAVADRNISTINVQFEHKINDTFSLRINGQGWERDFEDERWTTPQYIADTGRFNLREPFRRTLPQDAIAGQADLLASYRAFGMEHKTLLTVDVTKETGHDEDYRYQVTPRNALPLDTRFVDPANPLWVPTETAMFTRQLRDEYDETRMLGSFFSQRTALFKGRLIVLGGLRYDRVKVDFVDSINPTNTTQLEDNQITHTLGVTWRIAQDRLVAFVNNSTSFNGNPIIDRGIGSVIGFSEGKGTEGGIKGLSRDGRLSYTLTAYEIERLNPASNPAYFGAGTASGIPQYLGMRTEQVRGMELETHWKATDTLTLLGSVSLLRPEITSAPDTPAVVGDTVVRTPRRTASAALRYRFPMRGLSGGLSATYTGSMVIDLGDRVTVRARDERGSYHLVNGFLSYGWRQGKLRHSIRLNALNLLNHDYVTVTGRQGKGIEFRIGYTVSR